MMLEEPDRPLKLPLRLRYLHRVLGTLAGTLGPHLATAAGRALARALFETGLPARQGIESNLQRAYPDGADFDRACLSRSVFEHLAAFWVEALLARRLLTPSGCRRRVRVADAAVWSRLSGRPAILVTTYLGNPVVAACALSRLVPPVHVLVDPASELVIRTLWRGEFKPCRMSGFPRSPSRPLAARQNPGLILVPTACAAETLPAVLRSGGRAMVLVSPLARGGLAADFLGGRSRFPATVPRLARRHSADIVAFALLRGPSAMGFVLDIAGYWPPADQGPTAAGTLQAVIGSLEAAIRRRPEQYLWTRARAGAAARPQIPSASACKPRRTPL